MEQFIVSARKYRPDTFESVVGQEHVTNTLKNAIRSNHLAQAFLFCGPRGVGKTTCARILAKTINCKNIRPSIEPCNECESCVSFNKNSSFNIYELDAASNNSVDDIRALVEQVRYAPQGAKYKIYIIDEVHMLSSAAFNAFLKTLEEPPSYAIFILATTERHKILPTILSRCQVFDFSRITVPDIVAHLKSISGKESINAEEEALHIVAEKADGALRDALSIFDQMVSFSGSKLAYADVIRNLNILDYDYYFRATDLLYAGNAPAMLLLLDEVLRKGFDAHIFLGGLCDHFRNLLVGKNPQTLPLLEVAETVIYKYKEQASLLSGNFILNALNIASQYDASYKSARNQRLHVEVALLKLLHLNRVFELKANPAAAVETSVPLAPSSTPASEKADVKKTEKEAPDTTAPPFPVPETKAAPPAPGKLPSIHLNFSPDTENRKEAEPKKTEGPLTAAVSESTGAAARLPFSEKSVGVLWLEYAAAQEASGKMSFFAASMRSAAVTLSEDKLQVRVKGRHVFDYLNEEKTEILAYINARLLSGHVALELSLEETKDEESVPYTLEEKFNALAQDNPQVLELSKKLGLEYDY
jgi:DNA polymerase-3 subunit gamma/tau